MFGADNVGWGVGTLPRLPQVSPVAIPLPQVSPVAIHIQPLSGLARYHRVGPVEQKQ